MTFFLSCRINTAYCINRFRLYSCQIKTAQNNLVLDRTRCIILVITSTIKPVYTSIIIYTGKYQSDQNIESRRDLIAISGLFSCLWNSYW